MQRSRQHTDQPTWAPPPPDPHEAGAYAVVDVETTGFSAKRGDRIVEIGVVLTDGAGSIDYQWATLLNPNRDPGPTGVHGITGSMVYNAPAFMDVAGDLAYLLSGRILVAHNARFDMSFLDAEWRRLGQSEGFDSLCTMTAARRVGVPAGLSACCEHFGISMGTAHSALDDARATAHLLARLDPGSLDVPGPSIVGTNGSAWSGLTVRR